MIIRGIAAGVAGSGCDGSRCLEPLRARIPSRGTNGTFGSPLPDDAPESGRCDPAVGEGDVPRGEPDKPVEGKNDRPRTDLSIAGPEPEDGDGRSSAGRVAGVLGAAVPSAAVVWM